MNDETIVFLFETLDVFFLDHREAGDLNKSYNFCSSVSSLVRPFVRSSYFVIKVVNTSPPKPLNGLSSNFQGMFPQTPSCASTHYFSNMSVRLSVNQLSVRLTYFH